MSSVSLALHLRALGRHSGSGTLARRHDLSFSQHCWSLPQTRSLLRLPRQVFLDIITLDECGEGGSRAGNRGGNRRGPAAAAGGSGAAALEEAALTTRHLVLARPARLRTPQLLAHGGAGSAWPQVRAERVLRPTERDGCSCLVSVQQPCPAALCTPHLHAAWAHHHLLYPLTRDRQAALSHPRDHPFSPTSSIEAERFYLCCFSTVLGAGRVLVLLPLKPWAGGKMLPPARQPVGGTAMAATSSAAPLPCCFAVTQLNSCVAWLEKLSFWCRRTE